jgi:hypothetical protein
MSKLNVHFQAERIFRELTQMMLALVLASLPFAAAEGQMRDFLSKGSVVHQERTLPLEANARDRSETLATL